MQTVRLQAIDQIDIETGFRCRKVLLYAEPPVLHCHDYYELFLILSDEIIHTINGRKEKLGEGTLVFIRKDDEHLFAPNHNSGYSFINLAFTQDILRALFEYLAEGFPNRPLLEAADPPVVQLDARGVREIIEELDAINTLPPGDHAQRSLAYRRFLLMVFCKYFADYVSDDVDVPPMWLKEFDASIKNPEHFSMSHSDIVALSGKTREHLTRSVRRYYQMSLSEYINGIRLNFVANSLQTTDLTIAELFYSVGFNNLSYAYMLFKRKFGVSPRSLRRAIVDAGL